jgi:isocitrate/isopropylmalate dehydrogenase
MLLRHLGEESAASSIEDAIGETLSSPHTRTRDVGGKLGTRAFVSEVTSRIRDAS